MTPDTSTCDVDEARSHRRLRLTLFLAYSGAVVSLSGIQLIVPALPLIQSAMGLSDSQIGLVTSLFLLPGVALSIPAGMWADRFGRRRVYSAALAIFGLGGVILTFTHALPVLFAVRFVQGAAFAAILPTSITLIGDVVHGSAQVRAQGHRNIVMSTGDSLLPLLGGALALVAWYAPFAVQMAALPLAVLSFRILDDSTGATADRPGLRRLAAIMRTRVALSIQASGLLRFLFKFAVLSYLPILLHQRGFPTLLIAASLSLTAGAGVLSALVAPALVRRIRSSSLVIACLLTIAASLAALAMSRSVAVTVAALVTLGLADVLYAVLQNALMVASISNEGRGAYIAANGAVRSLGKFAAPSAVGLLLLVMDLEAAFLVMALLAVVAVPTALPLRAIDGRLAPAPSRRPAAGQ